MSEVIERVARAIYDASRLPQQPKWDDHMRSGFHPGLREGAYKLARAAIEALRLPDEAMLAAAWDAMNPEGQSQSEGVSTDTIRDGYDAMIDAALNTGEM
jgi:hypothetical protein